MKKQLLAGFTGIALAIGSAGAAHAAPTPFFDGDSVEVGGWSWDLSNGALDEIERGADDTYMGDTLDDGYFQIFDDVNDTFDSSIDCENGGDGASYDTLLPSGDLVVTCESFTSGPDNALTLTASLRVFGGDAAGRLGRVTYLVTNTSSSAIDYSWELYHEFGECGNGIGATGGDNDATLEVTDFWATCASDGSDEAPIAIAWGSSAGIDKVESLSGDFESDDIYLWSDTEVGTQVSIAAGDSRQYAFYYLVEDLGSDNPEYEALNAEFNDLAACLFDDGVGPLLLAGLEDVPSNWGSRDTDRDCFDATLAETGVDAQSIAGLAGFALIAGALVLAVRRRASES